MKATSQRQREELASLEEQNKTLGEHNQKLGAENNRQEAELANLIKKVEVNSML
jgi:predicted RNase H-like nuclease (RuvC/YqgF family)